MATACMESGYMSVMNRLGISEIFAISLSDGVVAIVVLKSVNLLLYAQCPEVAVVYCNEMSILSVVQLFL